MDPVITDSKARGLAAPPAIPKTSDGFTPGWIAQALAAGGQPGRRIAAVESQRIGEGVVILA